MKKDWNRVQLLLLAILIMIIALFVNQLNAQDKRFTLSAYTEPQHYSESLWSKAEGFNFGVAVEYQMRVMYFKVQTYVFPDLRGQTYFDFQGTLLGFNHHSRFMNNRIYGGAKVGLIKRSRYTYPMVGFEAGFEWYFDNGFYIGTEGSYNFRNDDKFWSPSATGFWKGNWGVKFGVVL